MENALDDLVRAAATEVYNEVVDSTPVTSGRLRAGWKMKRGDIDATIPDPKLRGGKYARPVTPEIDPATPGGNNRIVIYNTVPYGQEVNSGSRTNAPTRFFQAAIARAMARFNR